MSEQIRLPSGCPGPAHQLLREVRLYGPLRARFGRSHWLAVDSPAEAVQALCVLFKGFRQAILGHTGPGYRVLVGEAERTDARDVEGLTMSAGSATVIRIAPVLHGRKKGGLMQIVIGAALLAFAPYAASALVTSLGAGVGASAAASFAYAATYIGKALIVGGLLQLLSPQRQQSGSSAAEETSYAFNGGTNIVSPGGPVPLIIGRMVVGSTQVSGGISTDEYKPAAAPAPSAPSRPSTEPASPFDDYFTYQA